MVITAEQATILAVDDNLDALYALEKMLVHQGFQVVTASSGKEALEKTEEHTPSVILLDVMMPLMDGLEVTRRLKAHPRLRFIPVILLTAKDSLEDVVEGLENGADGYITKPFKPEELLARTRAALRTRAIYDELQTTEQKNNDLIKQLSGKYVFDNIIGSSESMQRVFGLVEKVAKSDSPVMIAGASGTGKELIARAIHFNSLRRDQPFVAKNCAAFSDQLLESQLFGHVRGAFTGAIKDQKGLFEAANKGTLFLDEIGEMPINLQAKLLRVLQEGSFMAVGTTEEKQVDVRVLAASNRDLQKMCEQGTFREDLYYRLNVITINLPQLSERREDIPLLVDWFLERSAERRNAKPARISSEVMNLLCQCRWKGNVRELENEIERMLILSNDEEVLGTELLSPHITERGEQGDKDAQASSGYSLKQAVENLERKMILETLNRVGWNKTNAAKELEISRSNLISKVQQYQLEKAKD